MSFNRQEKRIVLVVIAVVLAGSAALVCKWANPRVATDLCVFGWDASRIQEGNGAAEPESEVLAGHMERVEQRIDPGGRAEPERIFPVRRRINLNTASEAELVLLDGIGPKRAEAIVRYRTEVGPFRTLEEVQRVEGIGPRTLARMAPWVSVEVEEGSNRAN